MPHRLEKLNELIKELIGQIILKEEEFGLGVLVTVMGVKTSEDILHSNIFISVFPTEKGKFVLEKLSRHIYGLQQQLNKKLQMRPVPKIRFALDTTEAQAQELDKIM
ncbi:MAG: hypothetical protein A2174_00655 [Candidatus Portnoybacteria bacterium RBG_13_41_18]|uniref:Ribosome-binding factor A n=1 Tax=Candidatus Portnoybacteria bacterium RBG_13_41_18 TaxID=1801991 RepID=A0A1G2F4Y8_9BACT|nr:MAG: hypothetical protein A2174_00655 [Candidatus Portnoybacteria bacterium RBG_13_41_18]